MTKTQMKYSMDGTGVQFEYPMGGGIGTGPQCEYPMGGGIGTDH